MQPNVSADDRSWAIYANAAGLLVFTNIPFANVIGTLLVWLKVRNDAAMPFAREHARTALNFQIAWTLIAILVLGIFVEFVYTTRTALVGFVPGFYLPVIAGILLAIVNAVICILGCIRASDLRAFENPLAIPFVR